MLNGVAIQEAFIYQVSDILLSAKNKAKVASLGQLPEAEEKAIEHLAQLLYTAAESASLHRLVDVAFHIMLDGYDYVFHVTALVLTEVKVLDNCDCLMGETQGEHLYLFGSVLFVEGRETKVGVPL